MQIDLNCDLGEGGEHDAALLALVTSCNIACGGHAGDETTMRQTVRLAMARGVAIGAHPGFADRENFGRIELPLSPDEIEKLVREQIATLNKIVREEGGVLKHIKPHGALYNLAARDTSIATAIVAAVKSIDAKLIVVGLAGSKLIRVAKSQDLRSANEAFVERTYQRDGSLTSRSQSNSLIHDPTAAAAQAISIVKHHRVRAISGEEIELHAETLCLHGDSPNALAIAQTIVQHLEREGIAIRAL